MSKKHPNFQVKAHGNQSQPSDLQTTKSVKADKFQAEKNKTNLRKESKPIIKTNPMNLNPRETELKWQLYSETTIPHSKNNIEKTNQ